MKRPKSNTCIAAIQNNRGRIFIGADRRMSWDFTQAVKMNKPKVIKRNNIIIAGTGDCYLLSLLCDCLIIPEPPINEEDLYHYMVYSFKSEVIKLLKNQGFTDKDKHLIIPESMGIEAVIAVNHHLYSLVIENPDPYLDFSLKGLIIIDEIPLPYATGCGGQLAWGSLLTTENMGLNPKERLLLALNVAAKVSPGCDNNIDIEHED